MRQPTGEDGIDPTHHRGGSRVSGRRSQWQCGIVEGMGIWWWPGETEILHGSWSRFFGLKAIVMHITRTVSVVRVHQKKKKKKEETNYLMGGVTTGFVVRTVGSAAATGS